MKNLIVLLPTLVLLVILSGLSSAQVFDRSFINNIPDEVNEHQAICVDRIIEEWSRPEIGDENYTRLNLSMALNRVNNSQKAIVFRGTVFNRFLQLEQVATVTCRISDEQPYLISFRVAR